MSATAPKHALITGSSSGIGAAITQKLLAEGWRVTGLSRKPGDYSHPHFTHRAVDIMDTPTLIAILDEIVQVDAVIHAAGIMKAAPLGQLSLEDGETLWRLHINAAQVLADRLVDKLLQGGRIVLLGSRTSSGSAGRSQYVTTKSAMIGMARSWAAELAPRGITVNIVAPGATETPMLTMPGRQSSPPKLPPIGRFIQPQEVADLVGYLLSPSAAAITGQQLVICGGASL
ncbi:SDR family NAD(P)-dependent oxidoreductase [Pectobacterium parmentieri]|uniref:SDR family NAD(P)-dependent oxidoreductase n=1 Tax=Pectobacterium parmentieri TaxID=1905730 RepID=A0A8B3FBX2_PECPM|nr:SDR family oxidoreductase [Pectobacterium parmentieri]AOR57316.1 oxidoreductase [Pectobacterium parmentieri]AYH17643.1 SDR family NAD(P)-dependent oxidoreductase [Pectobacterium parmentieri]AYH37920.1 SDR family NAD(P)-dependent oxidoreductase [Pectobacterium parmentieri]AZS58148.1 SDR family NAD(P)-dependent oxidoreductase [Pectobacterium parmentieri]MBI0429039.1 SDR family oxidoreductase [Pectobacterium parmentieri]